MAAKRFNIAKVLFLRRSHTYMKIAASSNLTQALTPLTRIQLRWLRRNTTCGVKLALK